MSSSERNSGLWGRIDPWLAAAIMLGLALRAWLTLSGRSPLDGDEAIMGIMGARMAAFQDWPIYFYGQHYLGTLELPALAALMLPGDAAWRFSIWPVRLTAGLYFVLLCLAHFALVRRLFGREAARWSVFFLAVSTFFWMDYSLRLRHVALMMAVGEALCWMVLRSTEFTRSVESQQAQKACRGWLIVGLLVGLGWWHYQLIAVYFAAVAALLVSRWRLFRDWSDAGSSGMFPNPRGYLFLMLGVMLSWLVAISLGLAEHGQDGLGNGLGVIIILGGAVLAVVGTLAVDHATPSEELRKKGWGWFGLGFLAGYAPALQFLIRMDGVLQSDFATIGIADFPGALRDFLVLDVAAFLEFHQARFNEEAVRVSAMGVAKLLAAVVALYLFFRIEIERVWRRQRSFDGLLFVLVFGLALVGFCVIIARPSGYLSRFFGPAASLYSIVLGYAAAELGGAVARRNMGRAAASAVATGVVLASFALWAPVWWRAPRDEIGAGGQRSDVLAILERAGDIGARRIDFLMPDAADGRMMFELQFASRLGVRAGVRSVFDRLAEEVPAPPTDAPTLTLVRARLLERQAERGLQSLSQFLGAPPRRPPVHIGDYLTFEGRYPNSDKLIATPDVMGGFDLLVAPE